MSLASDLVNKVQRTGAKFELTSTGFNVLCEPGSIPPELRPDLRQQKPEIISYLIQRRYEPVYPHQDQREDELKELVRRVEDEGYVLLWSTVLQDLVAFHRDDVDLATIPAGFVPYSDEELRYVFNADEGEPSPDGLRLIHAAKKTGAIITNSRKEGSGPGNA